MSVNIGGYMKFNLEFRRFCLTGLDKSGGEWTLVWLVHNIKKSIPNYGEMG